MKIGFALQVNDAAGGNRVGQRFSNNSAGNVAQDRAYLYTSFFDTAILEGFTKTTTRTAAPDDIDDDTTTVVSASPSKPSSSKPSSSKPSSTAAS